MFSRWPTRIFSSGIVPLFLASLMMRRVSRRFLAASPGTPKRMSLLHLYQPHYLALYVWKSLLTSPPVKCPKFLECKDM